MSLVFMRDIHEMYTCELSTSRFKTVENYHLTDIHKYRAATQFFSYLHQITVFILCACYEEEILRPTTD